MVCTNNRCPCNKRILLISGQKFKNDQRPRKTGFALIIEVKVRMSFLTSELNQVINAKFDSEVRHALWTATRETQEILNIGYLFVDLQVTGCSTATQIFTRNQEWLWFSKLVKIVTCFLCLVTFRSVVVMCLALPKHLAVSSIQFL